MPPQKNPDSAEPCGSAADRTPRFAPIPAIEHLDFFATCPNCGYYAEAVTVFPTATAEDRMPRILVRCGLPCAWYEYKPYRPQS